MAKRDEKEYFSHDYAARADDKIKRLVRKHKMLGYGIYWALVEDLYNNGNAVNLDYPGIADDLECDLEILKSVINDFDLFKIKGEIFFSLSIKRRLKLRKEKSRKARKSANDRWKKVSDDANALPSQSEGSAIKEKKTKEKKTKENLTLPREFDVFWKLYGKDRGEKKCRPIWETLTPEIQNEIIYKVPAYVASTPEIKFRKDPLTYLVGEHWKDAIIPASGKSNKTERFVIKKPAKPVPQLSTEQILELDNRRREKIRNEVGEKASSLKLEDNPTFKNIKQQILNKDKPLA